MLALWGPLIIVGFLVLVFRGGEERDATVATATDGSTRTPAFAAGTPSAGIAGRSEQASGFPGAGRGMTEAFDGGFPMRTSMASPRAYAGRGLATGMPADVSGRLYPSPPGPTATHGTGDCRPARAGRPVAPASGSGRPKGGRAPRTTTAAMHRRSGCDALRRTTGVRRRAARPGSPPADGSGLGRIPCARIAWCRHSRESGNPLIFGSNPLKSPLSDHGCRSTSSVREQASRPRPRMPPGSGRGARPSPGGESAGT